MEPLQESLATSPHPAEQFKHLTQAATEINDGLSTDEQEKQRFLELSQKLKIRNNEAQTEVHNKYFYMPYGEAPNQSSATPSTLKNGTTPWNLPQFVPHEEPTPIPQAIQNHIETASALTLKGLLPDIGRAWISVDSTLYLWNYDASDVAGSAAYNIYSELDQVITSVAIVLPRKDTFQDFISHVLVIATTVEIVLVGVERSGSRVKDPVHLHPTALRCSTDGVRINKIVGTYEGRIFLAGSDSYVYEFQYSQDHWRRYFGYKCVKCNMSASFASYLVPQSFLEFRGIDPIIDIVVDSSRQLLYTLSRLQMISLYDLGDDGESFVLIRNLPQLAIAAQKFAQQNRRMGLADQPQDTECKQFKTLKDWVTSLHVIPVVESSGVHLVAVTRNCMRIYLTTTKDSSRGSKSKGGKRNGGLTKPEDLRIVNIRLPPPTKYNTDNAHNVRAGRNAQNIIDNRLIGLPGEKPVIANPFSRNGRQGQWNNIRSCLSNGRITVVVDIHKESDAYDTLSAFCQDSAHEAYARDDVGNNVSTHF
jgi:hypothetical protein